MDNNSKNKLEIGNKNTKTINKPITLISTITKANENSNMNNQSKEMTNIKSNINNYIQMNKNKFKNRIKKTNNNLYINTLLFNRKEKKDILKA